MYRIAVLSLWASLCSNTALAAPCDKAGAQAQGRPRIGLVLGGGARGAAHVGVLKVLKEMHIPIDCIAGNSMGAIVGGLYASRLSPEEIEREIRDMDWDDVLEDQPPRPERQFRRKRDDDNYLVKKQLGYFDFDSAEAYLRLYYDTVDNRNRPRSGAIGSLEWIESVESLGADSDFSQLSFMGGLAHSWEKNTFFGGFEFDYTADGVAPVQNRFRAGGFTKLSGFTQDQLSGQQVLLVRSGYYRRLGNVKWLPAYAGVSLEYGNVYEDRDDISLAADEALLAGSVFLGMDTVLGPVYLGYGHAEQGNDSIYLYLGRLF